MRNPDAAGKTVAETPAKPVFVDEHGFQWFRDGNAIVRGDVADIDLEDHPEVA